MLPWYMQILVLLGITVIVYPIIVLLVLKYFYFPSLMRSVVDECFKLSEEKELEKELAKNLPMDENPLETGDCQVFNGNIVRKDNDSDMTEDELRDYFWGTSTVKKQEPEFEW